MHKELNRLVSVYMCLPQCSDCRQTSSYYLRQAPVVFH